MNISKAAKQAGLSTKTVRYYADISLVVPASRSSAQYRIYDNAAVQELIFVRRVREFGFSIDDCRELLSLYRNEKRKSADVKNIAKKHLENLRRKQAYVASLSYWLTLALAMKNQIAPY